MTDWRSLEREYMTLRPAGERLGQALAQRLGAIITSAGIELGFPPWARVKPWPALVEHIITGRLERLSEVPGLVEVRLAVLFRPDLAELNHLLAGQFGPTRPVNQSDLVSASTWGYPPTSFVVYPPAEWLAEAGLVAGRGLTVEIQAGSLAQHTWAAAVHSLSDTPEKGASPNLQRAMHRVSALLETLDIALDQLLSEKQAARTLPTPAGPAAPLNLDWLERTLDARLPPENKEEGEAYSELLEDLIHFGLSSRPAVGSLLDRYLAPALASDRQRAVEELEDWYASDEIAADAAGARIQQGVFFTHIGLVREMLRLRLGERFNVYIRRNRP